MFNPDQKYLITCSNDKSIKIFKINTESLK